MTTILLARELYVEAFKNLGHYLVITYFKSLTWLCAFALGIIFYAFTYRLFTGFAF